MEESLRELLRALYARGQERDAHEQAHAKRLLNLEPETAQFLHLLVRLGKRRRILEIGTSNGYSTIWLAHAAAAVGGRVASIERDAEKQAEADQNLRQAGLRAVVDLHCGDATAVVQSLAGPFDCIFFDADRLSAPTQLALLAPKMTPDVLLLCDNVHSHPEETADYLAALEALPDFERTILPIGKGLSVAYRVGNGAA